MCFILIETDSADLTLIARCAILIKMKKTYRDVLAIILVIAALSVLAVFDFCTLKLSDDQTLNKLINDVIPRICGGVLLFFVLILIEYKGVLIPEKENFFKNLLWCLPCYLVVLANFPFSALICGNATIDRADLIWLFILKCLAISLMEEMLFRGLLQSVIYESFEKNKYKNLITVAVTSAIFGGIHLFNLFAGAGVGATFLQVGYSFLIGAMLSAVLIKTKNIWLCVLLHAVFDIGGLIVTDLGSGPFQDTCFWVLTAVCGVICLAYILYFLLKNQKPDNND